MEMKKKSELRVAVVGAGMIAENYHLPSLMRLAGELPELRLSALCDVVPGRAQTLAQHFGFERHYVDYTEMLQSESPDAVWLLVPVEVISRMAADCLTRGVPVLIEKPPAPTCAEARELAAIATAHNTPNLVAFNRRYTPLLRKMKERLDEAGGLRMASCQFYRVARTDDRFSYSTGLHGLDALRFLAGDEVTAVQTRRGAGSNRAATLSFRNGASATIEILPQVGLQSERYTAHAGDRTIIVDGAIHWLTLFPGFLHRYDQGRLTETIDNTATTPEEGSGFYGESAHFIECLRRGCAPTPDLVASICSLEIAEAVEQGKNVVFRD
jgi:myo-inositol 2-dehydrogenase/D-chiro-inositol 1-dehydrogenase